MESDKGKIIRCNVGGRELEISIVNDLLPYQREWSVADVKAICSKYGISGLRVSRDGQPPLSLEFLGECSFLKKLSVSSLEDCDFGFLSKMVALEFLLIPFTPGGKYVIDLSNNRRLVRLDIFWRKALIGLENCTELREVYLRNMKSPNLKIIENNALISTLRVDNSSITSIEGVEKLSNLRSLNLGLCRKLQSIGAINGLQKLETLSIDGSSKIEDWEFLEDVPNLRELVLINCKGIPTIKFLRRFPLLEKVILSGNTYVVDGDLSPLPR